jgi:hypothetical protein
MPTNFANYGKHVQSWYPVFKAADAVFKSLVAQVNSMPVR